MNTTLSNLDKLEAVVRACPYTINVTRVTEDPLGSIQFTVTEYGQKFEDAEVMALPYGGAVLTCIIEGKPRVFHYRELKGGYASLAFALEIWFG